MNAANILRVTPNELLSVASPTLSAPPDFRPRLSRPKKATSLPDADAAELGRFRQYLDHRELLGSHIEFSPGANRTIADNIAKLYSRLKMEPTVPIAIFGLLAKCGVEVRFTSLESLSGAVLVSTQSGRRPHGVLINSDQPSDRQRFSAAHELAHLVLGHTPHDGQFIDVLGRKFDPTEVEADTFASELLIPLTLLKQRHAEYAAEPATHRVLRLSRLFLVSFQAMGMRLAKLGLLRSTDVTAVRRAKPSDVAAVVGPAPARKHVRFAERDAARIAKAFLPDGWHARATPDVVRLLQETAYSDYLARVPEQCETDTPAQVYETVAKWVATTYPLIA